MNDMERYLRQATRGLWGTKKHDAQMELRGAIEDKVYRYTLLGLNEQDALSAALRDLGKPSAVARALTAVHTGPATLRIALLLGMAGVLGLKAVAQVPSITAAPMPALCKYDAATLSRYDLVTQKDLLLYVASQGGIEKAEAACRANARKDPVNGLLRLSDLLHAFNVAGVEARIVPGTAAFLQVRLPREDWQPLNLNDFVRSMPVAAKTGQPGRHEPFISLTTLLNQLRMVFRGHLSLSGLHNPTLTVGPASMQLGTKRTPVQAVNLYSDLLYDDISRLLQLNATQPAQASRLTMGYETPGMQGLDILNVPGVDGTLYALIGTAEGRPMFTVRASQHGQVSLPCRCTAQRLNLQLVATPQALTAAMNRKEVALLVYRLDATDLRTLKLLDVPVQQLRVQASP